MFELSLILFTMHMQPIMLLSAVGFWSCGLEGVGEQQKRTYIVTARMMRVSVLESSLLGS